MTQSFHSPGFHNFLKAFLSCCLGPGALWLFPAVGQAQPQPCIKTHASLGLGCLTKGQWDRQIEEWAALYRGDKRGEGNRYSNWYNPYGAERPLAGINADRAYAHVKALMGENVKPGQGVTIGFYDDYVFPHSWFEDITLTNKLHPVLPRMAMPSRDHGLAVTAAAAGRGGVAPGANVTVFNYGPADIQLPDAMLGSSLRKIRDYGYSRYFKNILENDIDIFSVSMLLGSGLIEGHVPGGYYGSNVRKNYRKTLDVLAQKDTEEKTIFVWGAGNENGTSCRRASRIYEVHCDDRLNASSPNFIAGLPVLAPELRSHWIAAVAASYDGIDDRWEIANYSNRCGIAADWCITAPVFYHVPNFQTYRDKTGLTYKNLVIINSITRGPFDLPTNYHIEDNFIDEADDPGELYEYLRAGMYGRWVDSSNRYFNSNMTPRVYRLVRDKNDNYFMEGYNTSIVEGVGGFEGRKYLAVQGPDGTRKEVDLVYNEQPATGTSIAAPVVAGSLAVMKQLFRDQLSNTELVTRLYATANKTGIYADRAIYGQGLLDLGAATNPWGVASFVGTGQSVPGQGQEDEAEPEQTGSNSCGQKTINTHASLGLGCLTQEKLNEKVDEWSAQYRAVSGFGRQWGLGAINADRAYAHLKAIKGGKVKPGPRSHHRFCG